MLSAKKEGDFLKQTKMERLVWTSVAYQDLDLLLVFPLPQPSL